MNARIFLSALFGVTSLTGLELAEVAVRTPVPGTPVVLSSEARPVRLAFLLQRCALLNARLLLTALFGVTSLAGSLSAEGESRTPVRVAPVVLSSEALPIRVVGLLQRRAEAELSFKTGGLIVDLPVRVGDAVVAGQVLGRLDTTELDAGVAQARVARDKAARDAARVEKLYAEKAASLENRQDTATALAAAEAVLAAAEFNLRHAVIVAPRAGRILRRTAEPGEWVAPGRSVLAFAADETGWLLKGGVPEGEAAAVRVGDRVDLEGWPSAGSLAQVSEAVDPASRTVAVEVALARPPEGRRTGSVVAFWIHPGPVPPRHPGESHCHPARRSGFRPS